MHDLAYYTGCFDPMHTGHIWTLLSAYKVKPFKKLILGIGHNNQKKPHASDVATRHRIAQATINALNLPFEVDIIAFDYENDQQILHSFNASNALRIIGSDSFIAIVDKARSDTNYPLALNHLLVVRQIVNGTMQDVNAAIAALPEEMRAKVKYTIIGQQDIPIESSTLRQNIKKAYFDGLIVKDAYTYIQQQGLYK